MSVARGERALVQVRSAVARGLCALLFAAALPGHAAGQHQVAVVDDSVLKVPPAGEWTSHGRDYSETRHSPLAFIDRANVRRLGLAWSMEVGSEGKVESTPIVWNGVLYGTSSWSVVYAIDLRTRTLKWRWDPGLVRGGLAAAGPRFCCGPVNRGVAIYRDKVYVGLLDGRLVALSADTGRVAWAVQTTPPGSDYSITGAPRVVKGKVIIGNGGAEYGVRGYVSAYDAQSGERIWRFYTVPGDPSLPFEDDAQRMAATTWHGQWWRYGGGGTPWDSMAYDSDADLLYIGTGNGSPWNHEYRSDGRGDNLFLSSIVALRPDTGQYVWHYQTTPADNWDFNAAQSLVLADLNLGGRVRKVIMQAPKNGFFYVLDRLSGEFLTAAPYVNTSWAKTIDPKGRPVEAPSARYGTEPSRLTPGPGGAHHWPPMAWNAETKLAYFVGQENSALFAKSPELNFGIGRWNTGTTYDAITRTNAGAVAVPPDQAAAQAQLPATRGFVIAWDPVTHRERWRLPFAGGGGSLSTAGGLLFCSDSAGTFFAANAETGEILWKTRLLPGVATPVTYLLDGVQYVSVMAGSNRGRVFTFVLEGENPAPTAR